MNLFKKITLVCFVAFASMACSNDDDNSRSNHFTYDGETYNLKESIVYYYGEDSEGVYNYSVDLFTTEINYVDGEPDTPVENIFSSIYFDLYTDNAQVLEEGTYHFSDNYTANTFSYSAIAIDYNFETQEEGTYYEITSGSVEILDNNTYEIEFEGTADGKPFSGYYKGNVEYYDDSSLPRPATQTNNIKFLNRE